MAGIGSMVTGTGLILANAFLAHLSGRGFSPATVRAYAFDVVNLARFLAERDVTLAAVESPLVFDWIDWQGVRRIGGRGSADRTRSAAASTVNRRVSAVRALFEYLVMTGRRGDNPVPSPRRGAGLRRAQRGLLGHLGPGRARAGGRLVRQPLLLPESLPANDIDSFIASLGTHRDRAMVDFGPISGPIYSRYHLDSPHRGKSRENGMTSLALRMTAALSG